jgi:outer membrane protein OmpA-like peptidoglycan-associated protein
VQCEEQDRSALIACLAPNRRVEISVNAVTRD